MSASNLPPGPAMPRFGRPGPIVASIALALAAGATPAGAQRTEIITRRAESVDSTERQLRRLQRQLDSLTRVYIESDQLTVARRRKVEEELGVTVERLNELSMRLASPGARDVRGSAQVVRMHVTPSSGLRASTEMSRALMQVHEAEAARPRGWIGIVPQGPGLEPRVEDGEMIVRYFSYPRIVSVDPSSPAQRAGVMPSDTLIAFNGRDVRENDISLTRLLKPSSRLMVRVLRDGKLRDIPMTVAPAPTRIVQRRGHEVRIAREPWLVDGVPNAPSFPRAAPVASGAGGTMRVRGEGGAPQTVVVTGPGSAPAAMAGMRPGTVFTFSVTGVAGAQMTTITEGLAQAIGISSGVLVTNVPHGTPASESGLRDGDVIVKVDGQPIASVSQVRAIVGMANDNGEREVNVDVLRKKKTQKLTLRW